MLPASFKVVLRFIIALLGAAAFAAACIAAVVYYVDPLRVYHAPRSNRGELYYGNIKWQAPGMIREHFLDGSDGKIAILGASLTKMVLPTDVKDILGRDGAYSFVVGSVSPMEASDQLARLLQSRSLETVICGMETVYYLLDKYDDYEMPANEQYPSSLYSDNILRHLNYLLNREMLLASFALQYPASQRALPGFYKVYNTSSTYQTISASRNGTFSKHSSTPSLQLIQARREANRELAKAGRKAIEQGARPKINFQHFNKLADHALANPKVEFILFLPPVHTSNYVYADKQFAINYYYGLKQLVEKLKAAPNAKVFAFDDCPEIVENTANYMDGSHFAIGVPRYFLYSVRENKHLITADNVDAYLRRVFDLWENGKCYTDLMHTVGFDGGPLDELTYSRYPYPKSPYALASPASSESPAAKGDPPYKSIFEGSKAVYDDSHRYTVEAVQVLFDEAPPLRNMRFRLSGGNLGPLPGTTLWIHDVDTGKDYDMADKELPEAGITAIALTSRGSSGAKFLALSNAEGRPALSFPALTGELDRLESVSFLVAANTEQVSATLKLFTPDRELLYEAPFAITKNVEAGELDWSIASLSLAEWVKQVSSVNEIVPELHFIAKPGSTIFIDHIAVSRNMAPQKSIVGLATSGRDLVFSDLTGTKRVSVPVGENKEFSFDIQSADFGTVVLQGSMLLPDGERLLYPVLEAGTWNPSVSIDGYTYEGKYQPGNSAAKTASSQPPGNIRFLQTGTPQQPWKTTSLTPSLFWSSLPGAEGYRVEVYRLGGKNARLIYSKVTSGNSFQIPPACGLAPGVAYRVGVFPISTGGHQTVEDYRHKSKLFFFRIAGNDNLPDQKREMFSSDRQPFFAETLTLADGLHSREGIFEAVRPFGQGWLDKYEQLLDLIKSYGYEFKSFEDFAPADIGQKIIYLRHDVHAQDISAVYPMLGATYRRGIPVVVYLPWEDIPMYSSYARDFLNLRKVADGRLIRLALHPNPMGVCWESHLANKGLPLEKFQKVVASLVQGGSSPIGTEEEIIERAEQHYLRQTISFNRYFPGSRTVAIHGIFYLNRGIRAMREGMTPEQMQARGANGKSYEDILKLFTWDSLISMGQADRLARYGQTYESTSMDCIYPGQYVYASDPLANSAADLPEFIKLLESGKTICLLLHPRVMEVQVR